MIVAYVLFIGLYALLVSFDEDGPAVRDRIAGVVVRSLGLLLLAVLVFVVAFTLWEGRRALVHLNFFTEDMSLAGPLEPLDVGGILHAVVGTLEQVGIALAITVPTGIVCAIFLTEVPGPFARLVRTIVEAMTALPSIVAGLFIYATVILALGTERSGLAASLALSLMMLPIIIRASDVVIRLVPGTLREASYAMGSSRWRTVWHVVLPTARSGLTTAVILGTARGVGET
ncbi:PstA family ABC transporter permease, partial [Streptomyces massasporeus]